MRCYTQAKPYIINTTFTFRKKSNFIETYRHQNQELWLSVIDTQVTFVVNIFTQIWPYATQVKCIYGHIRMYKISIEIYQYETILQHNYGHMKCETLVQHN